MAERPILPAAYFPPVSYFLYIIHHPAIFLESKETYPKQTIRNRCVIYTSSGEQMLSVPVSKPYGNHTKTEDVRISYRKNWQSNHWRTITAAYNNSPFFIYFKDDLEKIIFGKHKTLLDLDISLLQTLLKITGIEAEISITEHFQKTMDPKSDLRYNGLFGQQGKETPIARYPQVFSEKFGFKPDLSFLDLVCNLGPSAKSYLEKLDPEYYFTQGTRS